MTTSAVCSLGHHDLCEYGHDAKSCECACHKYRMLQTAEEVDEFISDELLNSAIDWFEGEPKMPTEDFLDRLFPKYGDIYDTDGHALDLDQLDNPAARRIMARARRLRKERDQ